MVRLIATDLDGTLLGPDGSLSDRSVKALRAAREAGWYVVLATGRPPFMVADHLPLLGDAVTHGVLANGSLVCTLPELEAVPFVDQLPSPKAVVESSFGFAEELLGTQKDFALKVVDAVTPAKKTA